MKIKRWMKDTSKSGYGDEEWTSRDEVYHWRKEPIKDEVEIPNWVKNITYKQVTYLLKISFPYRMISPFLPFISYTF